MTRSLYNVVLSITTTWYNTSVLVDHGEFIFPPILLAFNHHADNMITSFGGEDLDLCYYDVVCSCGLNDRA